MMFRKFHPRWHVVSPGAKKLLKRNTFQVLGRDLVTPSKFICCWTKNGKDNGGTGQTLCIAQYYDVPIFNLYYPEAYLDVLNYATNISLVK
jgi:hypothetical protein